MIRKATTKDFDGVFVLLQQLYDCDTLDKKLTKKLFSLQKNKFVRVVENKTVGYAQFTIRLDVQNQGKVALLADVIIDKRYRGDGLGQNLLAFVESKAKKQGCVELQFSSTFRRKKAHTFYTKQGYKKTAYLFWKRLGGKKRQRRQP